MKQHYLPQCYLKEFCTKYGTLETIDINLLKFKRKVFSETKFPAEVCRSKDFYTIDNSYGLSDPNLKGIDPLYLEKKFHNYERLYSQLVDKIKKGQNALVMQDAEILLYAIIDIKMRNQYFRDKTIDGNKENVIDDLFNGIKGELADIDLTEYDGLTKASMLNAMENVKEKYMKDTDYAKKTHLSSLVKRKQEQFNIHYKLIKHLLKFEWVILKTKNLFITSDNPGISLDQNNKIQNTKFDKNFFFFFPLTPSHCLGISPVALDLQYQKNQFQKRINYVNAENNIINMINEMHGYHLTQYLFSNNKAVIDEISNKINKTAGLV